MKTNVGAKIRLGIFVTIAAAFFFLAIYFIGEKQQMFTKTFHISVIYKNVNGLEAGNNVRFSGINVGTVDGVEILSDTAVKVDMVIDNDVQKFIKKDATASVGSEGLMGDKIVSISPGSPDSPMVEDGAVITAGTSNSIEEIMEQVRVVAENAAYITYDLSLITSSVREGRGTAGKLFMDSSMAQDIDKTITNLKQGTKGFEQNMEAAKHNFLLKPYFKKKEREREKKQEENGKEAEKK